MLLHLLGEHNGSTNTRFRANETTIPVLNQESPELTIWPVRPVHITRPKHTWTGHKYRPVRVNLRSLLTRCPSLYLRDVYLKTEKVLKRIIGWFLFWCKNPLGPPTHCREKKKILLNIEHRIMQRMTPNSENLPLMNKGRYLYMTSVFWPPPPCHVQNSRNLIPFVCFWGTPLPHTLRTRSPRSRTPELWSP